ncbi:MAG: alpha/beta hydrolase [Myxococcales bacterium]|nr:alpha/beta hydrolase [Myxococcales bacterium]
MERLDLDLGGRRLRCLAAGPEGGPLVIVTHGFPDDPTSFTPLLGALADAGYRALAPWTRGYGASDPAADGCYAIAELGRDLVDLIGAAGHQRAALVGHDWGAIASYAAAARAPDKIRDLITLAVPPLGAFLRGITRDPGQLRRSWYIGLFQLPQIAERRLAADDFALIDRLWAAWSPGLRVPADRLRAIKETFRSPGTAAAALAYYRFLRPRAGHLRAFEASRRLAFRRLRVPALVLAGRDDGCIGPALFADAVRWSDAPIDVRILDGVGHFMHLEDPAGIHRLILDRLGEPRLR